jgi:S-formylglutathione hydrolase FrmB
MRYQLAFVPALAVFVATSIGCAAPSSDDGSSEDGSLASGVNAVAFPPPSDRSFPFQVEGQQVWIHRAPGGAYHTYDALRSCSNAPARKVHVRLPASYGTPGLRHPVIYMNDGDTAFWGGGAAGKSWRVADTLARIGSRVGDPIVVAMEPIEREREYTYTFWMPTRASGGLAEYARQVGECIKPFIDRVYATDASREKTAIVGSSHGGLAAFWIGTRYADRFGFIGALSPSFWAGLDTIPLQSSRRLESTTLVSDVRTTLRDPARRPRVWVDWGLRRDGQFHNDVIEGAAQRRGEEMVSLLKSYGYQEVTNLYVHVDPIGGHDEDAWAYRFELLLGAFAR